MRANNVPLSNKSDGDKKTSTECTSTTPASPVGSTTAIIGGGQTATPTLSQTPTTRKSDLTASATSGSGLAGNSGGFLKNKAAVAGVFAAIALILLLLLSLIVCLIRRRRSRNGNPHTLLLQPHHDMVSSGDKEQSDDGSVSDPVDNAIVTVNAVSPNEKPPPPPAGVIKPYNPIYDEPRPSRLEDYMKSYEVWFLVDDSSSMRVQDRWGEARAALNGLVNFAIQCAINPNGINISFFNSTLRRSNIQKLDDITVIMNGISLSRGTPTGARVQEILEAHLDKLDSAKGDPQSYASIKPLDLIVITDGVPNDPAKLTSVLIEAGARIRNGPPRHHPNCMGVQFIQIGNDPVATQHLSELLDADTGHMVDTVPYGGPGSFTPDTLARILLGALHPNMRTQGSEW